MYLRLRKVLSIIVDKLRELPGVREIILFGSVAEGKYRPDSDVDVLVILDNAIDKESLYDVAADIYVNYNVPVTVIPVTLEQVERGKDPWIMRIIREGKVLWRREIE